MARKQISKIPNSGFTLQNFPQENLRGFTLLEILISLSIIVTLLVLMSPTTVKFYQKRTITAERDAVLGYLRRARALSIGNQNELAHGLIASSTDWIIFSGNSYVSRNIAYDEVFPKSGGVKATGATEIVFSSLSGNATSTFGTTTLTLAIGAESQSASFNTEGGIFW